MPDEIVPEAMRPSDKGTCQKERARRIVPAGSCPKVGVVSERIGPEEIVADEIAPEAMRSCRKGSPREGLYQSASTHHHPFDGVLLWSRT